MKTSSKILWGVIAASFVAVLILPFVVRFFYPQVEKNESSFISFFHSEKSIIGNSKTISHGINVTPFDSIDLAGHFAVSIRPSETDSVSITSDENILPYYTIATTNHQLIIALKPGIAVVPSQMQKVIITTKILNEINLAGKITLDAENIISDHLTLSMHGKGNGFLQGDIKNLNLNLRGKSKVKAKLGHENEVNLNVRGSGMVNLSGEVKNLTIHTSGNAMIQAGDLIAENVIIQSFGKSDITVHAIKTLSATTMGDSEVKYYGNPSVNKSSSEKSSIKKISEKPNS